MVQAREDAVRSGAQLHALTQEVAGLRSQITSMQANYVGREDFRDHEVRLRALEATARKATQ